MTFLCKLFGHSFREILEYSELPEKYRSGKKCVTLRVCRWCGFEEVEFSKHEFPALPKSIQPQCESERQCLRCGYIEVTNHKVEGCSCKVCRQEFHDLDEHCTCRKCHTVSHGWYKCECVRCKKTKHQLDPTGCRCLLCGEAMHDWKGCKCQRCGKEHDLSGCTCKRCGAKVHDWNLNGVYDGFFYHCRRCRSYMHCESGNITEI
jgi:hypothetical protein